jgi:3-phenylpropionate/trans-cinnamate dioxygenase ferredoxin reductase subunit
MQSGTAPARIDRIVVVGAGECGARAVAALRDRGFQGGITLVGDEVHAPYERPPLSKAALLDDDEPSPVTVATTEGMAELAVDFRPGETAASIDRAGRSIELGDGQRIGYDRLLLAVGASARRLPIDGGHLALTLRTFDDAVALRARFGPGRRVVIIGAGLIGLELAAAASAKGCEVTVLEVAPRPLGRIVPSPIADVIAARHADAGVDLRCGVVIDRLESSASGTRVIVGAPEGPLAIEADVVVAGIGSSPNVALAESAGLDIENGIAVDATLATSDPAIFAAGDCCSFPHIGFGGQRVRIESWRNALDQGDFVAASLLGVPEPFVTIPWFWSDQYDLGLQVAGLPPLAVVEVVRRRSDGVEIRFGCDADGAIVSAGGVAPGTGVAKDIAVAQRLIATRARPEPALLADTDVSLKSLLATAQAVTT